MSCTASELIRVSIWLTLLSLSKNAIGPGGLKLLGKALVTNNTLQFLELDACELIGNPLRPQLDGLLALSKGVQSVRSSLRYLKYVHFCCMGASCF